LVDFEDKRRSVMRRQLSGHCPGTVMSHPLPEVGESTGAQWFGKCETVESGLDFLQQGFATGVKEPIDINDQDVTHVLVGGGPAFVDGVLDEFVLAGEEKET
jgi:hypothetical protein